MPTAASCRKQHSSATDGAAGGSGQDAASYGGAESRGDPAASGSDRVRSMPSQVRALLWVGAAVRAGAGLVVPASAGVVAGVGLLWAGPVHPGAGAAGAAVPGDGIAGELMTAGA